MDQRDPRYKPFLSIRQPLQGSAWCGTNDTRIVLYVPGHWGSYTQSRSLGAHGIKLTGQNDYASVREALSALSTNTWNGNAIDEHKFVFDVYSLDFSEQGGALNGNFLRLQSSFLAAAVDHLVVSLKYGSFHLGKILYANLTSQRTNHVNSITSYMFNGWLCRNFGAYTLPSY